MSNRLFVCGRDKRNPQFGLYRGWSDMQLNRKKFSVSQIASVSRSIPFSPLTSTPLVRPILSSALLKVWDQTMGASCSFECSATQLS
jgi:hypothetical protein